MNNQTRFNVRYAIAAAFVIALVQYVVAHPSRAPGPTRAGGQAAHGKGNDGRIGDRRIVALSRAEAGSCRIERLDRYGFAAAIGLSSGVERVL